jgi:RimJ/RimL family protein N-acetyltransferase
LNLLQTVILPLNESTPLHRRGLLELLGHAERYWQMFGLSNPVEDYDGWMAAVLDLIRSSETFLALVDGRASGLVWICAIEHRQDVVFSVEVGGFAARKTPGVCVDDAMQQLIGLVFEKYNPRIIRTEYLATNKAARRAMKRIGFSHAEPRRGMLPMGEGELLDGEVMSLTRVEWHARQEKAPEQWEHGRQKEITTEAEGL